MKKGCGYCHDSGLLILRIVLVAIFAFHGITKIMAGTAMMGFVGGAPAMLGLTFLSTTTWFYLAVAGELAIALLLLVGLWTRFAVVILWIIMFFAMTAKKWAFPMIEMDMIIAALGLVLFVAGPGMFAICKCNKGNCDKDNQKGGCCGGSCKTDDHSMHHHG